MCRETRERRSRQQRLRARIQRAGCAFVLRSDGLSASAYGLSEWARPTRVPCSLQEEPTVGATAGQGWWHGRTRNLRVFPFARAICRSCSLVQTKFSEPVAVSSAPPTDVSASAYSPSGGASTYFRSVLAARTNLGRRGGIVKSSSATVSRKLRSFLYTAATFAIVGVRSRGGKAPRFVRRERESMLSGARAQAGPAELHAKSDRGGIRQRADRPLDLPPRRMKGSPPL